MTDRFRCLDVARAAHLDGERQRGRERAFLCPNHDDRRPSLTINDEKDAWLCGPCGAKGNAWQLAAFLAKRDPDDKPPIRDWLHAHGLLNGHGDRTTPKVTRDLRRKARPNAAPREKASDPPRDSTIDRTFDYCDASGVLRYQTVKYAPKDFRQRRPDGRGGWIWNLDGVDLIPYALDRLVDSTPDVYVTEGEGDAETCWARGIAATCNVGGARRWVDAYSRVLVKAAGVQRAYMVPDHDIPGHEHAAQVAASLHAAGVDVRVLHLPGLHDDPRPDAHGRDISDWFQTRTVDDLKTIAAAAPVWTPTPPPTPSHWQRLDVAALDTWQCDELQPIVDGLIARRTFNYIAAETQTGKSLLGQYLARLCVQGGQLFGRYAVTPVERVGYVVLEDPPRRIRDRFLDMRHNFPAPIAPGRCVFYVSPGFTLLDDQFWQWLEYLIVGERRQLLFLDTYQKATPGLESFDDKAQGPILHRLAELPRRLDVTLTVIDHIRKQTNGPTRRRGDITIDDIKGSGGKAQNADSVILMARTADRREIRFQSFSKDFDQPVRILLRVAPQGSSDQKFTYIGDLDTLGSDARARGDATRARLLDSMPPGDWVSVPALAQTLGVAQSTVQKHLKQLLVAGVVDSIGVGKAHRYRKIITADTDTGTSATTENSD